MKLLFGDDMKKMRRNIISRSRSVHCKKTSCECYKYEVKMTMENSFCQMLHDLRTLITNEIISWIKFPHVWLLFRIQEEIFPKGVTNMETHWLDLSVMNIYGNFLFISWLHDIFSENFYRCQIFSTTYFRLNLSGLYGLVKCPFPTWTVRQWKCLILSTTIL